MRTAFGIGPRLLLLLGALCSAQAHPRPLPARERERDGQKLQAALSAAIRSGNHSLLIPAGVYRFNASDLLADNATDLVIEPGAGAVAGAGAGVGVTLLFRCNWGLVLRSCTNVTVRNVTIDYDPPCYSQGVVINTTTMTTTTTTNGSAAIRYTVDAGFPTPDADARFWTAPVTKVIRWHPGTRMRTGKTLKLAYGAFASAAARGIRRVGPPGSREYEVEVAGAGVELPGAAERQVGHLEA